MSTANEAPPAREQRPVHVRTTVWRPGGAFLRVHRFATTEPGDATFVFLHGIGVSSRYFRPLAMRLAAHGEVLLVDLPGFAGLRRPTTALDIGGFAEVVAAALDDAEVTGAIVLAQSMGTQVATELLATRPDLAHGAVLVGPTVDAAARSIPAQVLRFARTVPHEPVRMRRIASRAYLACGPRWYARTLPAMINYPIEHRIRAVEGPLTLVRGDRDAVTPPAWIRTLLAAAPDASARTVPGAAHSVVLDHADEMADAALEVLVRTHTRGRDRSGQAQP